MQDSNPKVEHVRITDPQVQSTHIDYFKAKESKEYHMGLHGHSVRISFIEGIEAVLSRSHGHWDLS